ncbi:MAG: aspartate kinase [Lachnospiraceae bacterium]|nr:aspartate kinase [Lachnospiraceae bacterium]
MKKVVKFGGSSLANAEQFRKVKEIITADPARVYVVPSAPGKRSSNDEKVTDLLYKSYELSEKGESIDEILGVIKARYDEIIEGLGLDVSLDEEFEIIKTNYSNKAGVAYAASRGEYLNGVLLAKYLGFPFIDAADVICFNEDDSFNAEKTDAKLQTKLREFDKAVIPGFYGSNSDGFIRTFSRGGSDITGSIVAGAINANIYENWTDVSGFMIADPRIVKNPASIKAITYRELRELSYMGATVLHEDAIFPVRKQGIPINIRNTNCPTDEGTLIVENTCRPSEYIITGIAGKKGFVAINIEKDMMNSEIGFGRKVLEAFEKYGISFEHTPSGIDTFSVLVHQPEFEGREQEVLSELHRSVNPDSVELQTDLALIAVVGRGMRSNHGVAASIFVALAKQGINIRMIDQGSSELNIIFGVKNSDYENAIKAVYDVFITNPSDLLKF